jgi:hypothetical protein
MSVSLALRYRNLNRLLKMRFTAAAQVEAAQFCGLPRGRLGLFALDIFGVILISSISMRRNNIDLRSKLSFCNVLGLSRL